MPSLRKEVDLPYLSIDRANYGSEAATDIIDLSLFSPSLIDNSSSSSTLTVPFPTHAFWVNLVLKQTPDLSYPVMCYPYGYKWSSRELQVSYPSLRRMMDPLRLQDVFNADLTFSVVEGGLKKRFLERFDPLSATLRFINMGDEEGTNLNSNYWETYMVSGSPYVTVKYSGLTPVFHALSTFLTLMCPAYNGIDDSQHDNAKFCEVEAGNEGDQFKTLLHGTQFQITTNENLTWLLFSSEPLTIVFDHKIPEIIQASSQFSGILRAALLPPPQSELLQYTSAVPQRFPSMDDALSQKDNEGARDIVRYSNVYPVGGDVTWNFKSEEMDKTKDDTNPIGQYQFNYETRAMSLPTSSTPDKDLLMLILPHHVQSLASALYNSTTTARRTTSDSFGVNSLKDWNDLTFRTLKGRMTPILGSSITFEEKLISFEFDDWKPTFSSTVQKTSSSNDPSHALYETAKEGKQVISAETRKILLDQIAVDFYMVLPSPEESVYGYGKQVARLAQLVHLENILHGDESITPSQQYEKQEHLRKLHHYVTKYLEGDGIDDFLLYDANFGGLVSQNGILDRMADFGNGWYNDHHFHYGYHLYACAVLGKLNSTFVSEYQSHVDTLMYDVTHNAHKKSSSSSSDNTAFFPFTRHKSWFDGHSFATGLFLSADGKSQESSTESINCYYSAYLWSTVRNNQRAANDDSGGKSDIINFTRLLLAMEIQAVKMYWHMDPDSKETGQKQEDLFQIYNPTFSKTYMMGNIGQFDDTVSTWFGSNPIYVHMINYMPITGISHTVFDDRKYVEMEYTSVLATLFADAPAQWKGYMVCAHGLFDPIAAWDEAIQLNSVDLDVAISKSQILYFISTMDDFHHLPVTSQGMMPETKVDSFCAYHDTCLDLNLKGKCCPTDTGFFLGCCLTPITKPTAIAKPTAIGKPTTIGDTLCSENPTCALLGLEGACCPTTTGIMLGCCDSKTNKDNSDQEAKTSQPTSKPSRIPHASPTVSQSNKLNGNSILDVPPSSTSTCPSKSAALLAAAAAMLA
eukprot:CAMPEP_0194360410 /NCGR_PEP_ID=MMETSP0174-20130528/7739_1 /TAXON_ID=216777 /ORGANISM="Proboscia alata, Strain PI-D3" /LENGTH=1027 /DNA_ID=CAMNT_0039131881 /DNA_START=310 /DNA_END=3393 /DNA_ORIENTATION=+